MKTYSKQDMDQIFKQKDVKGFVDDFVNMKDTIGTYLEVPANLQGAFLDLVKKHSKLYSLVDNGLMTASNRRIRIIRGVTPAKFKPAGALTAEDAEEEEELYVEFSTGTGHKVTKAIFLPDTIAEDAIADVEYYVLTHLTKAIALALDDAILNGKGDPADELEGILPAVPTENKKTVTLTETSSVIDLIKPINVLDSGEYNDSEIVAIVNRDTYYNDILEHLLNTNNPDLLPKFIVSHAMPKGQVLYADFSKYIVLHRGNFRIENSTHVKFLDDEIAYLGTTGFQGKPTIKEAFVLVTLS